jgi:hypothetical protein
MLDPIIAEDKFKAETMAPIQPLGLDGAHHPRGTAGSLECTAQRRDHAVVAHGASLP